MVQDIKMYKAKGLLTIPPANVFFPENIHKIFIQTNGIRMYVLQLAFFHMKHFLLDFFLVACIALFPSFKHLHVSTDVP